MTRANEYKAYFAVAGDFDPSEITQMLGISPSEAWKKGDRNEKTHYERKFSRWNLDSQLDHFASLETQVMDVLDQLQTKSAEIAEIKKTHTAYMQLVGWFHSDYPGMHFEEELIMGLAKLHLSVDFDFYYLYSDRREDS